MSIKKQKELTANNC